MSYTVHCMSYSTVYDTTVLHTVRCTYIGPRRGESHQAPRTHASSSSSYIELPGTALLIVPGYPEETLHLYVLLYLWRRKKIQGLSTYSITTYTREREILQPQDLLLDWVVSIVVLL